MNRKMIWNDGLDSWTEEELLCMKYLNVCYGKGGGSAPPPPPSSVQQSTTAEFPTELRPFVSDIFEKSQAIQEQRQEEGYQPELTQQLASFTPEQEASFQGIQNVVGQTQPLFDEATTLARQSGRAATDPAEVAALMNPFLRNVTDIQKREAQRVGDVQEQQLAAQASQAGAFGGSRAAILEAERQRNLNQQLGDIEAQGLAASFQNAQNQLQNQFGRESAAAAQLGALGAAIPAQQFKEFGALSGIGAAKQQQAQRAFDIATQQAREEYGFPMATLQDFSSILRGFPLPATQNVSKQTFSPAQPLSTQLLGLGTGLAGLAGAAGAFKKAGGLVGAPVGMKNGGYVKLAGGGGLGQMMQGKVKKYAEGGSTQIELLSQYSLRELEQLLNNPARAAELGFSPTLIKAELDKKVAARGSVQDAARASAQGQFIEGMKQVPGQIVDAAQALPAQLASVGEAGARAGQAISPYIPRRGALADQTADVLKSFMTRDGKKLGDNVGIMDPTGMVGETRAPASLLSAPQMAEEIVGSGPQGMMAEEIVTSPAGPSISGLTPATGVPPLPSVITGGLPQDDEPLRGPSISGLTPATGVPPLPNVNQLAPGDSPVVPPPSFLDRLMSDRDKRAAEVEGGLSNFLTTTSFGKDLQSARKFMSQFGDSPENIKMREKFKAGVPQDYFGRSFYDYFRPQDVVAREQKIIDENLRRETNPLLQPQAELLSAKFDPVKDKEFISIDEDPGAGAGARLLESQPLTGEQKIQEDLKGAGYVSAAEEADVAKPKAAQKVAAPTKAAPTAPDANNIDMDIQRNPDLSSSQGMTQNSYSKFLKDFREGQNKDYSAEVEKSMGPAPTYEKGEEPDFAARKWLALANFGAGILASGGGKTLAQSIGEAAKPALKELADIGKEERKIKRELRTERNAQKRMKYQDKLQRFDLQRKLRSDDLDSIKAFADIKLKQDRNDISREDASVRRIQAMSTKAMNDTKIAILDLNSTMDAKGQVFIKDVMAKLDDLRKIGMKSSVSNSMYGVDAKTATAAYQAQLPSVYQQFRGRVLKDGKIMTDGELASLLKVGPTTQPGTTVNVPNSNATITMGNVSN